MDTQIKDIAMVMVVLSYFFKVLMYERTYRHTYRHTVCTYGQSHDNQICLDRLVTKFSKVWGLLECLWYTGALL